MRIEDWRFSRIAVVGCGLIGGSIELAVRRRHPSARIVALDRGDSLDSLRDAQLVILSAPVLANIALLGAVRYRVSADALITDTGSTKAAMAAAGGTARFIGGHPIAGAAAAGREAARADLFVGRPWILSRSPAATDDDAARLEAFVASLGAVPSWMDPAEHDRLFAFLSHLPQLAVSALMDVVGTAVPDRRLGMAGAGLRDSTRLASSPADVWAEIAATNGPAIREGLDALIAALTILRDDPDGEHLRRTFAHAAATHARLRESA